MNECKYCDNEVDPKYGLDICEECDGEDSPPASGSRQLADCNCDEDEEHDNESYSCEECEAEVLVCLGCYTIVSGCDCGHCPDGAAFRESNYLND